MYYCYYTYNIIIIHISSCPIAIKSPSFTISQLSAAAQAYFNLGISTATRKAYTAFHTNITHSGGRLPDHLYQFAKIHCCCLSQIWPNKIYPMQRYKCTSLQYNTEGPEEALHNWSGHSALFN